MCALSNAEIRNENKLQTCMQLKLICMLLTVLWFVQEKLGLLFFFGMEYFLWLYNLNEYICYKIRINSHDSRSWVYIQDTTKSDLIYILRCNTTNVWVSSNNWKFAYANLHFNAFWIRPDRTPTLFNSSNRRTCILLRTECTCAYTT